MVRCGSAWSTCTTAKFAAFSITNHFYLSPTGETWAAEATIGRLNEKYRKQVLVNFYVGADDRDSNTHIIHVSVRTQYTQCMIFISLRHLRPFPKSGVVCTVHISQKNMSKLILMEAGVLSIIMRYMAVECVVQTST